jgi:hypothetical protein
MKWFIDQRTCPPSSPVSSTLPLLAWLQIPPPAPPPPPRPPCPLPQGCALSSNVIKFSLDPSAPGSGPVSTAVVIRQPWLDVSGWALPQLPPLITDILLSLDDKYLFFSNWLQGVWGGGQVWKGGGGRQREVGDRSRGERSGWACQEVDGWGGQMGKGKWLQVGEGRGRTWLSCVGRKQAWVAKLGLGVGL